MIIQYYNDNDIIKPLCIRLPKITVYARKFNTNITMSFRVNNIDFESKPVYGGDDDDK